MVAGRDLFVAAPASRRLIESVPKIIAFYQRFNKRLRPISVNVPKIEPTRGQPTEASALFLSMGLDSFYSLYRLTRHPGEDAALTHFILIHGFDIALDNHKLFRKVRSAAEDVANQCGKALIVVTTNVRRFSEQFVHWDWHHGAALASVGLCLDGRFRRVHIACSMNPGDPQPWGSHPDLDPLWSTGTTSISDHGSGTRRADKARIVANFPLAQRYLRVCYENPGGAYNCGRCGKCVRTMLQLQAADALRKMISLPRTIPLSRVRYMRVIRVNVHGVQIIVDRLRASGNNELAEALARAIRLSLVINHFSPVLAWLTENRRKLRRRFMWNDR
jgi:hypothetical protein